MMREAFLASGSAMHFGASPGISDADYPTKPEEVKAMGSSPSITFSRTEDAISDSLRNTFAGACEQGWDGYDATPVSAAALSYALQFLGDLPSDIAMPEIGADVDGFISLDWDFGPRRVFSVRVDRDGTLYYAGLYGYSTYHGSETLRQGIPKAVAEGIKRAIRAS